MSKVTRDRESQDEQEARATARRRVLLQKSRESSPDGPVDRWVKDQLQQVYNDVVLEPVPQDFVNLLKKIDQKKE